MAGKLKLFWFLSCISLITASVRCIADGVSCTPVPTGSDHEFKVSGLNFAQPSFTVDSKFVSLLDYDGKLKTYDIEKSEEVSSIDTDVSNPLISPNGEYTLGRRKKSIVLIENRTGKVKNTVPVPSNFPRLSFSQDGTQFNCLFQNPAAITKVNINSGKPRSWDLHKLGWDLVSNPQSTIFLKSSPKNGFEINETLPDGSISEAQISVPGLNSWTDLSISPKGDSVAVIVNEGVENNPKFNVLVYDLKNKQLIHKMAISSEQKLTFSPDGNSLFQFEAGGGLVHYNLISGVAIRTPIPGCLESRRVQLSTEGSKALLSRCRGEVSLVDLKTNKVLNFPIEDDIGMDPVLSPDGKFIASQGWGSLHLTSTATSCVDPNLKIEESLETDCPSRAGDILDPTTVARFAQLISSQLCGQAFNSSSWNQFTPDSPSNPIHQQVAEFYLKRFQKPGGFDPDKHTSILVAILKSSLPESHPQWVAGALQNVAGTSPKLYNYIFKNLELPNLKKINPTGSHLGDCLSSGEKVLIQKGVLKYADSFSKLNGTTTNLNSLAPLRPLRPVLASINANLKDEEGKKLYQKKTDIIDAVAENVMNEAGRKRGALFGVFPSKLYQFSKQAVNPLFGEPHIPITDLTLLRSKDSLAPVILGTEPIVVGEGPNEFGFYTKFLKKIPLSEDAKPGDKIVDKKLVSWIQNGRRFNSFINVTAADKSKLIPEGASPDYNSIWKDGNFAGVVVTGSNLKDHNKPGELMDEYLAFYQGKGFEFKKEDFPIKNLKGYLGDLIQNGKVDYLIKEAHSDGDEKNLFRMDQTANVSVGTKLLPSGKKMTVYLVYPDKGNPKTELLSNQEFGNWIHNRDAKKNGQLVYFNTSCWSDRKALHETEEAGAGLLNIPTTTLTNFFYNPSDPSAKVDPLKPTDNFSAEYLLFSAFLKEKSFAEMREALKANAGYASGQENGFIFPDEKAYDDKIRSLLKVPLKIEQPIFDDQGKPYSMEQRIHP